MSVISKIFIAVLILFSIDAFAQNDLPVPSPKSTVSQTVGMTEITIEYSSPGAKGRNVWGELVPYGELWRTGANKATKVSFSRDVMIKGDTVPAGNYSIFTIPGESEWTVILNKNTELWGAYDYKEAEDQLRIKVKPEKTAPRERMTFIFSDFDYDQTDIDLEWAGVRVSIPVKLATDDQALRVIEDMLQPSARDYSSAAVYTLRTGRHYDKGLQWIDKAIEMENHWYYNWVKAELLKESGKLAEAIKYAKTAKELGDKSKNFFYKDKVEKALKEWK